MDSGMKYRKDENYKPVILYAQMGIDPVMVANIKALAEEEEHLLGILAGLQNFCGITEEV